MCGRYKICTESENIRFAEIIDSLNSTNGSEKKIQIRDSGDVYPGDHAPAIVTNSTSELCKAMRWGFESNGKLIINARSETALEKPMFKKSAERMRCIVPAIGYYEWNERRERFFFTDPNGDILKLAGLFRIDQQGHFEFTILTRDAYGACGEIHSRMPLIIRDSELWLRDASATRELLASGGNIKLDVACQSPQQLSMF